MTVKDGELIKDVFRALAAAYAGGVRFRLKNCTLEGFSASDFDRWAGGRGFEEAIFAVTYRDVAMLDYPAAVINVVGDNR